MARHPISITRQVDNALNVLGDQIRLQRIERSLTIKQLADQVGVDPRTIRAAEAGKPNVAIGTVLSAAAFVGVPLFGLDGPELALMRRDGERILALLPSRVVARTGEVDDDF